MIINVRNYKSLFKTQYNSIVIFDKDGTLVEDDGYVYRLEDFKWKNIGIELLEIANKCNSAIVVMSNQPGIEKGFYSRKNSVKFAKYLIRQAEKINIRIRNVYLCPHAGSAKGTECNCRKPKIGMYLKLMNLYWARNLKIVMVGNSDSDKKFARNAGIKYLDVNSEDAKSKLLDEIYNDNN